MFKCILEFNFQFVVCSLIFLFRFCQVSSYEIMVFSLLIVYIGYSRHMNIFKFLKIDFLKNILFLERNRNKESLKILFFLYSYKKLIEDSSQ
jgi:hypothetical protein